eukprot:SAG11_NODE_13409_length_656_cov_1.197487_1_plen_81_part_10
MDILDQIITSHYRQSLESRFEWRASFPLTPHTFCDAIYLPENLHYDRVFQSLPDAEPEQIELLEAVIAHVLEYTPDKYIYD